MASSLVIPKVGERENGKVRRREGSSGRGVVPLGESKGYAGGDDSTEPGGRPCGGCGEGRALQVVPREGDKQPTSLAPVVSREGGDFRAGRCGDRGKASVASPPSPDAR